MPAAANVVINDGATTPVAHTFVPIGRDDKAVLWFEQSVPTPLNPLGAKRIGYKQVREVDARKQLTGVGLTSISLWVPTLEVLGNTASGIIPPATLAYTEVFNGTFRLPERGLKQERKDLRVLTANLFAHAMMIAAIDDLQPTYNG